ncbi:MAG: uracil-DNA glycosylase [Terriglobia bacterium]
MGTCSEMQILRFAQNDKRERLAGMGVERKLQGLNRRVINCRKCGRLVGYREKVAREKRRAYRDQNYWGRPIPGFGDPQAELLVLGLAPAAHGGNRTGRVFTGDRAGDFLFRALYEAGFANQPESVSRDDGLKLRNCYITAAVRCCPPGNKPSRQEEKICRPYLEEEFRLLRRVRAVLALGQIAHRTYLGILKDEGQIESFAAYPFGHGAQHDLPAPRDSTPGERIRLFDTYHPSQQNTQTGRLTAAMMKRVLSHVGTYLAG